LRRAAEFVLDDDIYNMFHPPLSMIVAEQCTELNQIMHGGITRKAKTVGLLFRVKKTYSSKRVYELLTP
jgi:hypothetical protein